MIKILFCGRFGFLKSRGERGKQWKKAENQIKREQLTEDYKEMTISRRFRR